MRILTICPKCNVAYKEENCPNCSNKIKIKQGLVDDKCIEHGKYKEVGLIG